MKVLEVKNLCKKYEKFTLDNVSFEIEKGTIMGFIGRNGAGKTTTLKSLLHFVHPDSGEVQFFGEDFVKNEMDIKKRIGFVAGGVNYYSKKKIKDITGITRRFYPNWDDNAYKHYMELFNLDESKTPEQLSAGMKVKYSLTLALSHNAELLLLDEPTSGLDPVSREEILDIFLDLLDKGITILFSTHITSDLDKCADTITYIRNGRIVSSRDIKDFKKQYRMIEVDKDSLTESLKSRVIGYKRSKEGYTALINAKDADTIGFESKDADLDDIMVHFE